MLRALKVLRVTLRALKVFVYLPRTEFGHLFHLSQLMNRGQAHLRECPFLHVPQ